MGEDSQETQHISGAAAADSEKASHGFDCNICLDLSRDPVVTLCGHLYCWSCIYKWFHYQSASLASDERPQCPVCKAEVSHTTVVPIYGQGQTPSEAKPEGKAPYWGIAIPNRPPVLGTQILTTTSNHGQQLPYRNPYQNPHLPPQAYNDHEEDSNSPPLFSARGSTTMDPSNLVVEMFWEMVYARVFGNSESLLYTSNSYHRVPRSNPRMRRQTMQVNWFLCRFSLFLFCCLSICLVLFSLLV